MHIYYYNQAWDRPTSRVNHAIRVRAFLCPGGSSTQRLICQDEQRRKSRRGSQSILDLSVAMADGCLSESSPPKKGERIKLCGP